MDRGVYQKFYEVDRNHFWKISRRRLILEWLQRYAPDKKDLKILDIGGACSIVSNDMRRLGNVTVIEPDSETVKLAQELFNIDIRNGSLPNDISADRLYDVVTLLDVLEHIDDDTEAITSVWKLLRPGGIFLCTVPAFPELWSSHDVALHHKRRYHYRGLLNLLRTAGFEIKRFSYYTSALFPITVIHRLARKAVPPKKPGAYSASIPPACINSLLCAIMSIERLVLRYADLPFGSSLIAICFKPDK